MTETQDVTAQVETGAAVSRPSVVTPIRFTTELAGYGDIATADLPRLQGDFAESLMEYFKGRVPVGKKMAFIGLQIQDSEDKVVGTAIAGSIRVLLGVDGEDAQRACDGYLTLESTKKKYPFTSWEVINDESEKKHAEERQRRKEYSNGLLDRVASEASSRPRPSSTVASSSTAAFETDESEDPNDLF